MFTTVFKALLDKGGDKLLTHVALATGVIKAYNFVNIIYLQDAKKTHESGTKLKKNYAGASSR